ncbi:hypothetical protein K458DRAFT_405229 [Lentithecium fluviatile CBS 122367]|uniref:Uncharacterized protein n=1 Tax=Lentithecium fluviatile CBS 122367 TaxID=1168545 RepID=A0A6G1IYX3_9PLEO|nr:hypothetical protein K458DRAFT_405229 [Lentithecium fluviatile CBS 122367]
MSTRARPSGGTRMSTLIAEIDAHLADQLAYADTQRPNTAGTMFVDTDEHGTVQVSYRNPSSRPSSPIYNPSHDSIYDFNCDAPRTRSPPLLVAQGMRVRCDRHAAFQGRAGLYVEGYDEDSRFEYDYDGVVMHIHKESSQASSQVSNYYAIGAEQYSPSRPLFVQDEDAQALPHKERKKRSKAVKFIQTVLRKIDRLGLMKKFGEERDVPIVIRKFNGGTKTTIRKKPKRKTVRILSSAPKLPRFLWGGWCRVGIFERAFWSFRFMSFPLHRGQ